MHIYQYHQNKKLILSHYLYACDQKLSRRWNKLYILPTNLEHESCLTILHGLFINKILF